MVVGSDGTVQQRRITVEQNTDNTWTVLTGLNAGEQVASANLQAIRDGMKVQPQPASEQTSAAQETRGGSK
jgi:membrane fusion protein (multidrug efflux system)